MVIKKQKKINKVCIISDCFVPKKNSAAGMIYNLSRGLVEKNIEVICVFGSSKSENWQINNNKLENHNLENIKIISSNFLCILRDGSYYSRFLFEIGLSFSLCLKIIKYRKLFSNVDLIIWYSPSAFLWLPAFFLKKIIKAPLYLILRDIFPDWLMNIGLVKNKILIKFLQLTTLPGFIIPDTIGCESIKDTKTIKKKFMKQNVKTLYNWPSLSDKKNNNTEKIDFVESYKESQHIYRQYIQSIYTGSDTVSQDLKKGMNFIRRFINLNKDKTCLIVNKFSPKDLYPKIINNTKDKFIEKKWDMVSGYILEDIYKLSDFGIVSLNTKHKTSNIPGKFISYIQFGLPILCFANKHSELSEMIIKNNCGCVIDLDDDFKDNSTLFLKFLNNVKNNKNMYIINSQELFKNLFSLENVLSTLIDNKY